MDGSGIFITRRIPEAGLEILRAAAADVTIVRPDEGRFTLTDSEGVSVEARSSLTHVQTIRDGRIYRP